ncbi:MAG: hypothetical protein IJS15_00390 [Victivallales bacterium]|nr:hypothetical protein [Victivallales bacterium]
MNNEEPTIFISSIGLGDYIPTFYTVDGKQSVQAKFVQNAIRKLFAPNASAIIFATRKALDKFFPEDNEPLKLPQAKRARDGAEMDALFQLYRQNFYQECSRLGLDAPKTIMIPDGKNMDELWEIFNKLYEAIPENARICFDPTHAFRHHPIIMTILFNYLRIIKNVKVVRCEYGAFELNKKQNELREHINGLLEDAPATTADRKKEDSDETEDSSPLFPLTEFFQLNDWTNAIHDFLEYGRTNALEELVEKNNCMNGTKASGDILHFVSALEKLANHALFSNLHEIELLNFKEDILNPLKEIQNAKENLNILPQLSPLFGKIERQLDELRFSPMPSWKNGFAMARWCCKFRLHPQLYTILQETCVSASIDIFLKPDCSICSETELKEAHLIKGSQSKTIKDQRDYMSCLLAVTQKEDEWKYPLILKVPKDGEKGDDTRKLLSIRILANGTFQDIREKYHDITNKRNAINHGFTGSHSNISEDGIQQDVEKMIDDIEAIFITLCS